MYAIRSYYAFPFHFRRGEIEVALDILYAHRQQLGLRVAEAVAGSLIDIDEAALEIVNEQRIGERVFDQRAVQALVELRPGDGNGRLFRRFGPRLFFA